VSEDPKPPEPRFLADVMLGTLAKWLRILGYDTAYDNRIPDDEIVNRCLREGRIALTRDSRLAQRRLLRSALLIESTELGAQLQQVLYFLGASPEPSRLLSRCVQCNTPLTPASPESVRDSVPPFVFQTQVDFRRCPGCGRIFWGGTHRDHIRARLQKLLKKS
jgi:uncharacterized protein with PIN domain